MKKGRTNVPVYDLHAINRMQLHQDIVAELFGDILKYHKTMHFPHKHTFYQLALIKNGSGTVTIDMEETDIKAGQIYFIMPGQVHCWNIANTMDGYVVSFSEKIFRSFVSQPFCIEQFSFFNGDQKYNMVELQGKAFTNAKYFMRHVFYEVNNKDTYTMDLVCLSLMSLLINISRYVSGSIKKINPEQKLNSERQMTLLNFRKLLNQHFSEKRLPKEYAAMLYVTTHYLNSICKDLLGKPAGEVIRDRILLEAKRLLMSGDISISEIAYRLNFKDTSYFTKFFKNYTGKTPKEFRKYSF